MTLEYVRRDEKGIKISVTVKGEKFTIEKPKEFHKGINVLKIPAACDVPDAVDVAFVVDATGSMQDEIDYLKAELNNIIGKIRDSMSDKELNLGCVFYRDVTDAFITKKSDLSSNVNTTINFIKSNNADGGGDYPEAVDQALNEAINHLSWRGDAVARIIFLVLDAPPHDEALSSLRMLVTQAATKGIRVVPVACSGIDKSTEYLMRSIALATNGTYVFLTDHSGVCDHHIEPTTDKYDVELLNSILFRVIYNFSHTEPCKQTPMDLMASADTLEMINPLYARDITSDSIDSVEMMEPGENIRNEKGDTEFFKWKYYPNPTFGIVHVVMEGELNELFVTDISGKILLRYEMKKDKSADIDLSDFPSGTYFISGEYAPEKIVTGRVILVH